MTASIQTALGWAVLHFVWQGALIGGLAAALLAAVRRDDNRARYAVGCAALGVALLTFAATFALSLPNGVLPPLVLPPTVDVTAPELAEVSAILLDLQAAPADIPAAALAWFWAIGALAMALRLTRGGVWARRLRRSGEVPVDPRWQRVVDALRLDLGIRRAVRLLRSDLVDGPAVVGWITPVVLVPATTLTALTPDQVRAVLAHELAHVRRHDHLVNALQALVEVLLFFHPVVWWLSHVVREEREHCCDAAAVRATGSELLLAQALTRLESLRLDHPSVALAAKTSRGPLMKRITRILRSNGTPQRHLGWRALSALGAGVLALGLGVAQATAHTTTAAAAPRLSLEGRDAESDYALVEARILQAVEAGNLSADAAKRTLVALRKTMFTGERRAPGRRRPGASGPTRDVPTLDRIFERRPGRDVTSSNEEHGRAEIFRRWVGERQDAERQVSARRRYEQAERDIKDALKSGDISYEDAEKRLMENRSELLGEERRREGERRREAELVDRKVKYKDLLRRIEAAVERAEISPGDARKKVEAYEKELKKKIVAERKAAEKAEEKRRKAVEKKERKERKAAEKDAETRGERDRRIERR
ncbi:MAG: M56 family metallopeptidase [Planctomycetota bacterium]